MLRPALLLLPAAVGAAAPPRVAPSPRLAFDADVVVRMNISGVPRVMETWYHLAASGAHGAVSLEWPNDDDGTREATLWCVGDTKQTYKIVRFGGLSPAAPAPGATNCSAPPPGRGSCGDGAGAANASACAAAAGCCWDGVDNWCWAPAPGPRCGVARELPQCNASGADHDIAAAAGCAACALRTDVDFGTTSLLPHARNASYLRTAMWGGEPVDVYARVERIRHRSPARGADGEMYVETTAVDSTYEYGFRAGGDALVRYRERRSQSYGVYPAGYRACPACPVETNSSSSRVEERLFMNYSAQPPAWRLAPPAGLQCSQL